METPISTMQKALLLAVMAYDKHYVEQRKEEQEKIDAMDEDEQEDHEEEWPEEMEPEDFTERFADWLCSEGLEAYIEAKLEASDEKRLNHLLGKKS